MLKLPNDETIASKLNNAKAEREHRHRENYTLDLILPDEFEDWSEAQAWEDDDNETAN